MRKRFLNKDFYFVIPFAFTAYYPASYFLTGKNPLFTIGGLILTIGNF
ncbi:ABC-2 family transporter protein [Streptococcus danieliae]|nr:ABC-2 family transporter protein [Streptococcus danieliae]NYS33484.1 ABC-2 family transporter protein [Streptococcus danieliae]